MSMSDLPKDMLEEIISRVPKESIGAMLSTCKNWNTLTYDQSFTKKHFGKTITTKENEFLVVMVMDYKVYLMSVNLHGIHKDDNKVQSSVMHKAKLISLNDDTVYLVDNMSRVFHCEGLLLCITNDINSRLVVWNPYCGQTRCIKPRTAYHIDDIYALGYEKKNNLLHTYKILRLNATFMREHHKYKFEIYNFNSGSWKTVDFPPELDKTFFHLGVSVKGNTYCFCAPDSLVCFDFTIERFGPRLPMFFYSNLSRYNITLSSVREEQLAVLLFGWRTWMMEIWVTTKIDPKEVSWNKMFLAVKIDLLPHFHNVVPWARSFFIDEKENVVVVLFKEPFNLQRHIAYIIGKDGYLKEVVLGEPKSKYCYPLLCSYVPSSFQIKQAARVRQQHHNVLVGKYRWIIGFGYFGFCLIFCIFLSLCFR